MKVPAFTLIILLFYSCGSKPEPYVTFENPQPEGSSNETSIPRKLSGEYFSLCDSSKIMISPQLIVKTTVVFLESHISELDSGERSMIKNDTSYFVADENVVTNVVVIGDSISLQFVSHDTIYSKKDGDVLRRFKRHYFLSHPVANDEWYVTALTIIENGLMFGEISSTDDVNHLRVITKSNSDTIFHFQPTRKQLKQFVKENGFSNQKIYFKSKIFLP